MSISSSLAAGVSGLNANAQRLASISDNIANSSTFGYKRTETDFHSMVIDTGSASRFTAGGVRTTTERLIGERGQIEGTTNATDVAVNGRGFLPVTDRSAVGQAGALPLSLMTTGSFRPDAEGILTNANGMVLMGVPAATNGTIPAFPRDSATALEPINIYRNQFTNNPTTEMTMAVNLPSEDGRGDGTGSAYDLNVEYFGNLGQSETIGATFTPDPATPNVWQMTINDSASNAGSNPVGTYTLTFHDDPQLGGTLADVQPAAGYDAATGTVEVPVGDGGGMITLGIGELDSATGITQLDTSFAPNTSKNGSSVGNLSGVEIGPDGIVKAVYDSGFTRSIYQVPVIDVANPNGLSANEGQTYTLSRESGDMFLWDSGQGPVGETVGYSREASTTEVAKELTDLIQTQRAYSSNAKIIQTVDEMLQETTNLKR